MNVRIQNNDDVDDEFIAVWIFLNRVTKESLGLRPMGHNRYAIENDALIEHIGI